MSDIEVMSVVKIGGLKNTVESAQEKPKMWKEYPLGDNAKLYLSNKATEMVPVSGFADFAREVINDLEEIAKEPHGHRSVDPRVRDAIYNKHNRSVNHLGEAIEEWLSFPVVVKQKLTDDEDMVEQFKDMLKLKEATENLSPEQKAILRVADVYAAVSVGKGSERQTFLFMEKIEGRQMEAKEKVPEDLAKAFGIGSKYSIDESGKSKEVLLFGIGNNSGLRSNKDFSGWTDLYLACKAKGLNFGDLAPRNVLVENSGEGGGNVYVVIDQGGDGGADGFELEQ